MSFEIVQNHCLSKAFVEETFPFDESTIVWKVAGKMFCLGNINNFISIALKCEPQYAIELREEYEQIIPGFHLNKSLWNTVYFDGLTSEFVISLINHSYEQVVQKLPKKLREEILKS